MNLTRLSGCFVFGALTGCATRWRGFDPPATFWHPFGMVVRWLRGFGVESLGREWKERFADE